MVVLQTEISENQKKIKSIYEAKLFADLNFGAELITSIFSEMDEMEEMMEEMEELEDQSLLPTRIMGQQVEDYKQWIRDVFEMAIQASSVKEFEELPPDPIKLPQKIAKTLIYGVLEILSYGQIISKNGFMLLSDVGNALGFTPGEMDNVIEQFQCDKRKEFTQLILENLSEKQCFWMAQVLWTAIHVDGKIHPNEYKYLENILHLLKYNQLQINRLQEEVDKVPPLPEPFDPSFNVQIFQYIVEIVLIDGEYSPEEAELIKELGEVFGYNDIQQEQIIEPIGSALMLRRSLFKVDFVE